MGCDVAVLNGVSQWALSLDVIRAVDVFSYSTGESMRQTVEWEATLDPYNLAEVAGMAQRLYGGDYKEALNQYDLMRPSLQREKHVQLLRLAAAINVDDDTAPSASREFQHRFRDDPCSYFVMLHQYRITGETKKSMGVLRVLTRLWEVMNI